MPCKHKSIYRICVENYMKKLPYFLIIIFVTLQSGCAIDLYENINHVSCDYFGACDYVKTDNSICVINFPPGVVTNSKVIREKIQNKLQLKSFNSAFKKGVESSVLSSIKYDSSIYRDLNPIKNIFENLFVFIDPLNIESKAPEVNCGKSDHLIAEQGVIYSDCLFAWLNQINHEKVCPENSSLFGIGVSYVQFLNDGSGIFEPHLVLTEMDSSPELPTLAAKNIKESTSIQIGYSLGVQLGDKIFKMVKESIEVKDD